jgi:hypothetical protein
LGNIVVSKADNTLVEQAFANLFQLTGNTARYKADVRNGVIPTTTNTVAHHLPQAENRDRVLTEENIRRFEDHNILTGDSGIVNLDNSPQATSKLLF